MIRRGVPAGSITTVAGTGNDGADGDASLTSPRFARSTGCGKTDVKRAYRLVCSTWRSCGSGWPLGPASRARDRQRVAMTKGLPRQTRWGARLGGRRVSGPVEERLVMVGCAWARATQGQCVGRQVWNRRQAVAAVVSAMPSSAASRSVRSTYRGTASVRKRARASARWRRVASRSPAASAAAPRSSSVRATS